LSASSTQRDKRGIIVRAFKALAVLLLVVLALPYLIAPFYRFIDPVSTVMLWRWMTGARVDHVALPLAEMDPALPRAVISAEDGSFCAHRGIDWRGLREAFYEADSLGDMRGGSTITQQVVKNLFLWPGRSYLRKALELPLALWINLVLPKRRVLEIYLNIVEWGPNGQFGAEAAARHAFGKSARRLTMGEAALLAAVLPNPIRRSARQPSQAVRQLARLYTARAVRFQARTHCIGSLRR
jgi:monofunctional biosynthetic peptidoglycan transglycosylase